MVAQKKQNALRDVRHRLHVTQRTLAKRCGLPESTLARIDSNPYVRITLQQAFRIADALEIDVRELLPQ